MDEIGVFFCHELAQNFHKLFLWDLCGAKGMGGGGD